MKKAMLSQPMGGQNRRRNYRNQRKSHESFERKGI